MGRFLKQSIVKLIRVMLLIMCISLSWNLWTRLWIKRHFEKIKINIWKKYRKRCWELPRRGKKNSEKNISLSTTWNQSMKLHHQIAWVLKVIMFKKASRRVCRRKSLPELQGTKVSPNFVRNFLKSTLLHV